MSTKAASRRSIGSLLPQNAWTMSGSILATAPFTIRLAGRAALAQPRVEPNIRDNPRALGRTASAEEVAAVITFLSTEDAGYLTGTTVDINGGSHIH